jgi:hypothetical protein
MPSEFGAKILAGRVSSVDAEKHRVAVQFFDLDGQVIPDLIMLHQHGGDYALPAPETPVLCILLDGKYGRGYVLGCFYTDSDPPPLDDAGQRSIASEDLRLGAHDASKAIGLDGDKSDGGTLVFNPGSSGATLTYFKPGVPPTGAGTPIPLEAALEASAENVKGK